jgi:hypothetical protein
VWIHTQPGKALRFARRFVVARRYAEPEERTVKGKERETDKEEKKLAARTFSLFAHLARHAF